MAINKPILELPIAFRFLQRPSRYKAAYGGRGAAKCFGLGTIIQMADGSQKQIQDIQVNDLVMGPDSKSRLVTEITSGLSKLYNIKQTTAVDYIATGNHILVLERSDACKRDKGVYSSKTKRWHRPLGRYHKWGDAESLISVEEYFTKSKRFKANMHGFKRGYELLEQEHDLDPYFVGYWLGDGTTTVPEICSMDPEIIDWFKEYIEQQGWTLSYHDKKDNKAITIQFHNNYVKENSPRTRMKHLLGNKHIPEEYFKSSQSVRLQLLAGFLDADGHAHKTKMWSVAQCEKHLPLLKQFKRLADSLGFKTKLYDRPSKCNGKDFMAYEISIGGNLDIIPSKIPRKSEVFTNINKNKDWRKNHIEAEYIGEGKYYGFTCDGDHKFLLGDGTVTHNSHSMAQELITRGSIRPLRVGCYREIQKSISTSVKQLLDDKIEVAGLTKFYRSTDRSITAPNGTEFIFAGLRSNPENVKSTEGLDIAWVEEARTVSQRSLDLLTPTVRKDDSEIWFSWNRGFATDPVDNMFLGGTPPPNSLIRRCNYDDNPFFPQVLRDEMAWDKQRDMDRYLHIWEGELIQRSEARVFSNWTVDDMDELIPEDCSPRIGADWGFSIDPTTLVECYVFGRTLYFRREAYKVKCEIDETPSLFYGDAPNIGEKKWENTFGHKGLLSVRQGHRIVADSARPETISYMKKRGFDIVRAIKGPNSVEEGVEFMKSYNIVVHPDCTHVIDELTHYSYKIDELTDAVLPILADRKNHMIDACRYAVEDLRRHRHRVISDAVAPPEVVQLDSFPDPYSGL